MKTASTLQVINRKRAAGLLVLALGVAGSVPTHAQSSAGRAADSSAGTYPMRPVRIVVPLPAGGSTDIIARALALRLTDAFGQTFVVDNRPGAGSLLALDIVASSAPDGYTLMVIGGTTVMYPLLYKSRHEVGRDFAPAACSRRRRPEVGCVSHALTRAGDAEYAFSRCVRHYPTSKLNSNAVRPRTLATRSPAPHARARGRASSFR